MLVRLSNWLQRMSRVWVVLLCVVIFFAFTATVLPRESARMDTNTGGESPDLSIWYGPADLYRMAEAYGSDGRAAYVRQRFTFDLIWPLVYLAFLASLISWLGQRAFSEGSRWRMLNLFPLFGALLDYLENISAALVMTRYPLRTPVIDVLAGGFTALKWTLLMLSFIAMPVLAILVWRKYSISKRKDA